MENIMNRKENILIRDYEEKDLGSLEYVVHRTIKESYNEFYPPEAIKYFLELHSKENMGKDIPKGRTIILRLKDKIIATGSIVEDEIKRVFILPEYQGRGYGRKIMKMLEKTALDKGVRRVKLCASLPSKDFYLMLGYTILKFTHLPVENDKKLEYYDMEKYLAEENKKQ
jgi:GNAT superfamily N-acetyltransferase